MPHYDFDYRTCFMTFMDYVKEFFRWTNNREPEGWLSWQHLVFVAVCIAITVFLGVFYGKRRKNSGTKAKQKVLLNAAIIMIATELTKIILISFRRHDVFAIRSMLPLFLCSINLFVIPLTAFNSKITKITTYFVSVYGPLCCIAGTVLAANYYNGSPIFSFDVLNSTITHCISGFAGVYIMVSGLLRDYDMTEDTLRYVLSSLVLVPISFLALIANALNFNSSYESNYMFLRHAAGTPFSIVENMAGHNPIIYPILVIILYLVYGFVFCGIYYFFAKRKAKKSN